MPTYKRTQYEWFFREVDEDDDKFISLRDLEKALARFKYSIDDKTLQRVFRETDLNGDSRISYKEYMYAMGQSTSEDTSDVIRDVFKAIPARQESSEPTLKNIVEKPIEKVAEKRAPEPEPAVEDEEPLQATIIRPQEASKPADVVEEEEILQPVIVKTLEATKPEENHKHVHDEPDNDVRRAKEPLETKVEEKTPTRKEPEEEHVEEKEEIFYLDPKFIEPELEGKVIEPKKQVSVTVVEKRTELMSSILKAMFNKYDKDGSGTISKSELLTLFTELEQPMTEQELECILKAEKIKEESIDYKTFARIALKDHNVEKKRETTVTVDY